MSKGYLASGYNNLKLQAISYDVQHIITLLCKVKRSANERKKKQKKHETRNKKKETKRFSTSAVYGMRHSEIIMIKNHNTLFRESNNV